VDAGGTASGTTVLAGGVEIVVAGGTASTATISGGYMRVESGGIVGTVTYSGGGTLQLDDSVHFGGGLVAGFAQPDLMDLVDIAFHSGTTSTTWAQSGTSGTLTVTDGSHTAHITLLGQYVAGQFHVGNDGQGGTVVTDPPPGDMPLVQPAAMISTSGAVG
jgi:autotransporter passenger strand-loop-strand repeat protein